jgi:hypothetical protein
MYVAAAYLLILAAAPALPAADVACIADRISAADRAAVLDEADQGGKRVRGLLNEAASACAAAGSWTSDHADRTERAAAAAILVGAASERLDGNGIPARLIVEWFGGLSPAVRRNPDIGEGFIDALQKRLLARGVKSAAIEAHATTIGALLGSLIMTEELNHPDGL